MGLVGAADLGEMADLVNDGALLRNQEQQQKAERFEHLSHSNVSDEVTGQPEKLPEHRGICSYRRIPCHLPKSRKRAARAQGSVSFTP